jgi:S1-C subfamily serine protease
MGVGLAVTADGLLVSDVLDGSPAKACGLEELDLITAVLISP